MLCLSIIMPSASLNHLEWQLVQPELSMHVISGAGGGGGGGGACSGCILEGHLIVALEKLRLTSTPVPTVATSKNGAYTRSQR